MSVSYNNFSYMIVESSLGRKVTKVTLLAGYRKSEPSNYSYLGYLRHKKATDSAGNTSLNASAALP